jgi:hypothetical protein
VARYDKIYETLARRAVLQGGVDVETFLERAAEAGMPADAIEARLIRDVEEGGPIFGKFIRSLTGAATSSVMTAESQGEAAAQAYAEEMISLTELEDVIDDADPDELEDIVEKLSDDIELIWVATLVNTCDRCLPLHGTVMTRAEWAESGYDPSTIHDGWESECHCDLTEYDMTDDDRKSLIAPLVRERVKSATGLPGVKTTQRLVAQKDLDRSMAAAERAKQSLEGRRTLRLMGQVNQEDQGSEEETGDGSRSKAG